MSRRRRSKSAAWHKRQEADAHVRAARAAGYRSRAAYKLLEICAGGRLLRAGMRVADLGAAPGGWCQVARELVGESGVVAAVDVLPMAALDGVRFVQGDFCDSVVQESVLEALGGAADVALSDMAPNLSGVAVRDQANAAALVEAVLAFCAAGGLRDGGCLLIKTFAGEGQGECRAKLAAAFARVRAVRPEATRKASREEYLLGVGYSGQKTVAVDRGSFAVGG